MVDYSSLEPELRCQALVGAYLQVWSLMEAELNDTLEEALGLDNLEAIVVTKNVQLRDKIHIVKTMISLRFSKDSDEYREFRTLLEDIRTASTDRNIMAHEIFGPEENGNGVEFLITRAKGKLTFPNTVWSISDFEDKCSTLVNLTEDLKTLKSAIVKQAASLKAGRKRVPMPSTNALIELGLLARQIQDTQNSETHPSTDQKAQQTPPSSEE